MRKNFNGWYGLVRDHLDFDPESGHVFLFAHVRRNRLKPLVYDGSGLWVWAKKLDGGRFRWPERDSAAKKIVLSHEELALLLGGIDLIYKFLFRMAAGTCSIAAARLYAVNKYNSK